MAQPPRITDATVRAFARLNGQGHPAAAWLVCDWARVMVGARYSSLPAVRADRLRSAAEYRAEIARQKAMDHATA